ncbi:MAG TPA: isocitrate lyase/phosphoenolpyruvate mutase family protein [Chloroflexota bacterium]|nr:isocitrate lyase/phosphoenolpyruvate mutase family protein [Chloroflexota bacterium]
MIDLQPEVVAAANAKSRRLRQLLHDPKILVMPGAYDVLSARLFESLGFPAIQGTSGGIAAVHGLYDEELFGRDGTAEVYREMAAAVAVPVNADGEKGYGGPDAMEATVRAFVAAGVAGMNLEDSDYHAHGTPMTLVPLSRQVEKIQAVMTAKAAIGSDFFLNARIDVFGTVGTHAEGMDEVIARGNAYAEAGADCIFIFRPGDRDCIRTLVREIRAPLSILAGESSPPVLELQELGVARVSYGSAFTRYAISAVKTMAEALQGGGDISGLIRESMPRDAFLRLLSGRPL